MPTFTPPPEFAGYGLRCALYANTVGMSTIGAGKSSVVLPDLTGKCRGDFADVQFADVTGESVVPYGHEIKLVAGGTSHFRYAGLTGGGSAYKAGYLYYNNPTAVDRADIPAMYTGLSYGAEWWLNEASGTLADATGNGNTGTAYGSPTYGAVGQVDGALGFDGTDDYVHCGTGCNLPGPITVAGWLKIDPTMAGYKSPVCRGAYAVDGWMIFIQRDWPYSYFAVYIGDHAFVRTAAVTAGTWFHYAWTYDKAVARQYVNGAQIGADYVLPGAIKQNASRTLALGSYSEAPAYLWKGGLDGMAVIAVAASTSELLAQYRAGAGTLWTWGEEETAAVVGGRLFTQRNRRSLIAPGVFRC